MQRSGCVSEQPFHAAALQRHGHVAIGGSGPIRGMRFMGILSCRHLQHQAIEIICIL
jgi:hypothetical protein